MHNGDAGSSDGRRLEGRQRSCLRKAGTGMTSEQGSWTLAPRLYAFSGAPLSAHDIIGRSPRASLVPVAPHERLALAAHLRHVGLVPEHQLQQPPLQPAQVVFLEAASEGNCQHSATCGTACWQKGLQRDSCTMQRVALACNNEHAHRPWFRLPEVSGKGNQNSMQTR